MIYCTLFDSNYLDKGVVMIESLNDVDKDALVYVLCMDDLANKILHELNISCCRIIPLEEFEDEDLLKIKESRSRGEYCWTCTAKLIKYVINYYDHEMCTYVDSDLFFYSNPKVLIDEMVINNCTVQVIAHNFPNTKNGKKLETENGKNCVQFNTFCNNAESLNLLDQWIEQCLDKCSVDSAGDQLYTSDWDKYDFVNISHNFGAGVAPWNVGRFKCISYNPIKIRDRQTGQIDNLVFYHFQNVTNKTRYDVVINPLLSYWVIDKEFIKRLYYDYLYKIEKAKVFFENNYDFLPIVSDYITDGKTSLSYYLNRVIKAPIKAIPIIIRKISLKFLRRIRKKEACLDTRTIVNEGE